jgi:hypothetical protein
MNSPWGRDQWAKRPAEGWSPFSGEVAMASDEKRRFTRSGDRKPKPRAKDVPERPFDRWLQKQLHAMYDEIASEPLPRDLLSIIDTDAASATEGKDIAGKPAAEKNK